MWSLVALFIYFVFPYDLSAHSAAASGALSWAFFCNRFPIWFVATFGYNAYWHITLYWLQWARRPMVNNRPYNWNKVAHNLFYSLIGVVIWTGFENVFAFLWASGKLAYLTDALAFSTPLGFFIFFLGLVAIPLWRDVHFYFAHRLLHYRPIYLQVHSLHHRNTDIEPFAGLCMHPVEHLYYYACILPSLLFFCSPFHFLWNGTHLLLSPGASHSGYEDHFQADNFHYIHHRYFECNYAGFTAAALDVAFGTFTARYKDDDKGDHRPDAKSTLTTLPTLDYVAYLLASCGCVGAWAYAAASGAAVSAAAANALAFAAGFGPVIAACAVTVAINGSTNMLFPFARKTVFENVLHLTLGFLFCSVPVFVACRLALM